MPDTPAVIGRACSSHSRPSAYAHSMSVGHSSSSSAARARCATARGTAAGASGVPAPSATQRSVVISRTSSLRLKVLLSGATRPLTIASAPSAHDSTTTSCLPVTGSVVNATPPSSGVTMRCTITAIAALPCGTPLRSRYATARSPHTDAQHPSTAWSTPSASTSSVVSYCPANERPGRSSAAPDERTATAGPRRRSAAVSCMPRSKASAVPRIASRAAAASPDFTPARAVCWR